MKALMPAQFVKSIEHTSEKLLNILRFGRKPAVYRLSGAQLSESRYRVVQRRIGRNGYCIVI